MISHYYKKPVQVWAHWTKLNGKRTKMLMATFAVEIEARLYYENKIKASQEQKHHIKPLEEVFTIKIKGGQYI